jgi:hypothetical protein
MWAHPVATLGAIAIVAEDTKAGREPLFLQPSKKAIAANSPTGLARSFSINVIERQERFLALAAALARDRPRSVVRESFESGGTKSCA